jgi:hypothetical protein
LPSNFHDLALTATPDPKRSKPEFRCRESLYPVNRIFPLARNHAPKTVLEPIEKVNKGLGVRITVSSESDEDAESGVLGRDESPELILLVEAGVSMIITSNSGGDVDVGVITPLPDESPESEERIGDGVWTLSDEDELAIGVSMLPIELEDVDGVRTILSPGVDTDVASEE